MIELNWSKSQVVAKKDLRITQQKSLLNGESLISL